MPTTTCGGGEIVLRLSCALPAFVCHPDSFRYCPVVALSERPHASRLQKCRTDERGGSRHRLSGIASLRLNISLGPLAGDGPSSPGLRPSSRCQSALKNDPVSASKIDPLKIKKVGRFLRLVHRATKGSSRGFLEREWAKVLLVGAEASPLSDGHRDGYSRFLKR